MRVAVWVRGRRFEVPCGKGEQDIKWLALVAAQRYSSWLRSQGHAPSREAGVKEVGTYLPSGVGRKLESVRTCPWTTSQSDPADIVGPSLLVKDVVRELRSQPGADPTSLPALRVDLVDPTARGPDGSLPRTLW